MKLTERIIDRILIALEDPNTRLEQWWWGHKIIIMKCLDNYTESEFNDTLTKDQIKRYLLEYDDNYGYNLITETTILIDEDSLKTPQEYLVDKLTELSLNFRDSVFNYNVNNDHIITVPDDLYIKSQYISYENKIRDEFFEKYPFDGMITISDMDNNRLFWTQHSEASYTFINGVSSLIINKNN